ncbi:adenine phosphoribosyltransferase [Bifidobacterium sp. 82T24]|uniref:adenine phosphoribosyltransferase n=1 Tax=Bifidobacterium pluvialisilvae TaxID=2834436 RepID=UPI001C57678A|nr:adenine phosphoribosyltransferase [Bifidobacterium pluvialisilvae]MBW3088119.1 adenine phosphoribosyltransferase [Bifidobacterium pluvialisilvae]
MTSDITVAQLSVVGQDNADYLLSLIRTIPGFPKEGINFRDFMPVLADAKGLSILIDALAKALPVSVDDFDAIAGLESRGFLIGAPLAVRLNKGFVAIRKAGKLPPPTKRVDYALEYGTAAIEVEDQAIRQGERVLVVDDLIATGGTAAAAEKLIEEHGATVAGFSFVMELTGIPTPTAIGRHKRSSLLTMPA